VGYLYKHAGTVPGFIVRAFRAPVFHPFQGFQAPFHYVVGRPALNIRHKTDAARVMLIFLPVQTNSAHGGSLQSNS
jgi:hypothetical protein